MRAVTRTGDTVSSSHLRENIRVFPFLLHVLTLPTCLKDQFVQNNCYNLIITHLIANNADTAPDGDAGK